MSLGGQWGGGMGSWLFFNSVSLDPPLVWVEEELQSDRYLSSHCHFIIRELRIKAYAQLLESYRSLSLTAMADTFGVTDAFIDR